jgi:hypothetical protein
MSPPKRRPAGGESHGPTNSEVQQYLRFTPTTFPAQTAVAVDDPGYPRRSGGRPRRRAKTPSGVAQEPPSQNNAPRRNRRLAALLQAEAAALDRERRP